MYGGHIAAAVIYTKQNRRPMRVIEDLVLLEKISAWILK
jgi:hypothetical protein